jgi:predicted transcriptional regulator YheO
MNEILKNFIPLVDFIAAIGGKNCEVVLHDLSDIDNSIIAIANKHVTNREVGDSITEFALKKVLDPDHRNEPYIVNYKGQKSDGSKTYRSSTFYIRDSNSRIIGLLCLNIVVDEYLRFKEIVDEFVQFESDTKQKTAKVEQASPSINGKISVDGKEVFFSSKDEMIIEIIESVLKPVAIMPHRMTITEKKQIVEKLKNAGVFQFKHAVSLVAKRLSVSDQTIYRYLREISLESEMIA